MEKILLVETSTKSKVQTNLFGLVLAGGKSSRMGFDKGSIDYFGKPQREYAADLLGKYCDQVFISCKAEDHVPTKLNPLPDQFEMNSPLNGILSAFKFNSTVAWLTVPVDMPLIDASTIDYLLRHRDTHKVATCFFDSEGKNPEPLFTLWETSAFEPLMKFYAAGEFSPRDFLKQQQVNMLSIPNQKMLTNINSVEDLKQFKVDQD